MINIELIGGPGDGKLLAIQGGEKHEIITTQIEGDLFITKIWYYGLQNDEDYNPQTGAFYFKLYMMDELVPRKIPKSN